MTVDFNVEELADSISYLDNDKLAGFARQLYDELKRCDPEAAEIFARALHECMTADANGKPSSDEAAT